MNELEETRKSKFGRVPRNNGHITLKINRAASGGCCSSWWGKKQMPQSNMDIKLPSTDYDDYEK